MNQLLASSSSMGCVRMKTVFKGHPRISSLCITNFWPCNLGQMDTHKRLRRQLEMADLDKAKKKHFRLCTFPKMVAINLGRAKDLNLSNSRFPFDKTDCHTFKKKKNNNLCESNRRTAYPPIPMRSTVGTQKLTPTSARSHSYLPHTQQRQSH